MHTNGFLILGLPRSRTAWLANFLSYDGFHCSHEGLNGCKSIAEYKSKFVWQHGDASTGLVMFDFEERFKDFKIVIIDRDIAAAVEYGLKTYGVDQTVELSKLKERLDNMYGMHVNYDEINDDLEDIWDYITHKPYNKCRSEMLKGLNIQVNEPYSMDQQSFLNLMESEDGGII